MGTSMAPSYANLLIGVIEGKTLDSSPHQPLIWLRYPIRDQQRQGHIRGQNILTWMTTPINTSIAIDQLPGSESISFLNKETHWIHTLDTTELHGMNIKEQESPFSSSRAFLYTFRLPCIYIIKFRELIGRRVAGVPV
ncbi:hypothetical protein ElyMa_000183300 [Elysia marginata]|uniref:Peptidase S8/S53 domain-containing protein n=1 Tax=Elysia marginata TaxID=1093978 RepID=A0AAV4EVW4_9GAST|nr:hypothetical protein ElyMa_000183300 [Elysia marginata]